MRAPERFDPDRGNLKTYLFAIARNLTLKNYRDQRAAEPGESRGSDAGVDPRPALEISSAVESAVAGLPHLQQEALVLFQYEGLTLEEVAHIDRGRCRYGQIPLASRTREFAAGIGALSKSRRYTWILLRRTNCRNPNWTGCSESGTLLRRRPGYARQCSRNLARRGGEDSGRYRSRYRWHAAWRS